MTVPGRENDKVYVPTNRNRKDPIGTIGTRGVPGRDGDPVYDPTNRNRKEPIGTRGVPGRDDDPVFNPPFNRRTPSAIERPKSIVPPIDTSQDPEFYPRRGRPAPVAIGSHLPQTHNPFAQPGPFQGNYGIQYQPHFNTAQPNFSHLPTNTAMVAGRTRRKLKRRKTRRRKTRR